jgi:hypothetical protein
MITWLEQIIQRKGKYPITFKWPERYTYTIGTEDIKEQTSDFFVPERRKWNI